MTIALLAYVATALCVAWMLVDLAPEIRRDLRTHWWAWPLLFAVSLCWLPALVMELLPDDD